MTATRLNKARRMTRSRRSASMTVERGRPRPQGSSYFVAVARLVAFARRDLYRSAVLFLMTPRLAALSITDDAELRTSVVTLPSAMAALAFLRADFSRDLAARLRSLLFSA